MNSYLPVFQCEPKAFSWSLGLLFGSSVSVFYEHSLYDFYIQSLYIERILKDTGNTLWVQNHFKFVLFSSLA